ncbi:MAG: NACHT domain-containing protein [Planctomycetes bacterium]|nr:NACHT domain-containing protein [Planctomycetota bacterium]
MRSLRGAVDGSKVRLRVAASAHQLVSGGGGWTLVEGGEAELIDEVYQAERSLACLLGRGTASPDREDVPIHGLITFGHSDARDTMAQGLRVRYSGGDELVGAQRLRDQLAGQPLEFVANLNCASLLVGRAMLELAPNVIATSALAEADRSAQFCARLLEQLAKESLVSRAYASALRSLGTAFSSLPVFLATGYGDWSFLGPERVALRTFVSGMYDRYGEIAVIGASLRGELGRVHVPLRLSTRVTGKTQAGEAATRGAHAAPESGAPAAESFEFVQVLAQKTRHWILRGGPGSGKTTTLRHCALEPPPGKLVLYLSLPIWLTGEDRPKDPRKLDRVLESIGAVHRAIPDLVPAIRRFANETDASDMGRNLVVLLDAFDEVPVERRQDAQDIATCLATGFPQSCIVISSRETAKLEKLEGSWQIARLEELRREQQERLLRNWILAHSAAPLDEAVAARQAREGLDELHGVGPRIAEMCGNPLLLTFLADQIVAGRRDYAQGRHVLLASVIERMLKGQYRKTRTDQPETRPRRITDHIALRRLLRALAYAMLDGKLGSGRRIGSLQDLVRWLESDDARLRPQVVDLMRALGPDATEQSLAEAIAEDSFFCLRPEHGKELLHWGFTHNLIQEALCAEHWWFEVLKQEARIPEVVEQLSGRIAREGGLDFWSEATALLAGWMNDDALVVELVKEEATLELGLRAMAAVDHLRPETVAKVLELLPDWGFDEQRAREGKKGPRVEAYEIIPMQTRTVDREAMAKVLLRRAGVDCD